VSGSPNWGRNELIGEGWNGPSITGITKGIIIRIPAHLKRLYGFIDCPFQGVDPRISRDLG